MLSSYTYLFISFLLISTGWTYMIDEDDDGTVTWIKTKYLTRANWTSSLKANTVGSKVHHPVWFVFTYLNYCGYCKQAKPGWEAAAQYAAGWSRYVKIGTYDCAEEKESQNDICRDEAYPQWRIFCPLTNATQLAFESSRRTPTTTPEDILMWSIKKINKIAPQCYGKTWPIRTALQPQSKDDLNRILPKYVKNFRLFVSDDILSYSLYVLNNSKTVAKEPIYRLSTKNSVTPGKGVWKGMRNTDGTISLEPVDSKKAMENFKLNKNPFGDTHKHQHKKAGSLEPTVSDVDSAVVWMVTKDLRRKLPALFGDVKAWLKVLHMYYPGSETVKQFLYDLMNYMNEQTTLTGKDLQNYINSTSVIKLPEIKFDHCKGSDPSKRGYTCSLWVLFHSMTVKQALLAEKKQLASEVQPTDLIKSIREYIQHFFLCEECTKHFLNMTSNAANEIHSYKDNVLYFWRGHNEVNERLRNDELTNDPAWPKVPFPTKEQCNACVQHVDRNNDVTKYNEDETYNFLKNYYDVENAAKKNNTANSQRYNRFLLFSIPLMSLVFFYN